MKAPVKDLLLNSHIYQGWADIWQNSPQVTWLWRLAIAAGIFDMWEARGNKKAAANKTHMKL